MSSKRVVLLLDDIYTARAKYVHELAYIVCSYAKSLGVNLDFEDDFRFHDIAVAYKTLSLLKETKLQIALRSCLKNVAMLLSIPTLDIELNELNSMIEKYTNQLEFEVMELGGIVRKESGIQLDQKRNTDIENELNQNNDEREEEMIHKNMQDESDESDQRKRKKKKKKKKERDKQNREELDSLVIEADRSENNETVKSNNLSLNIEQCSQDEETPPLQLTRVQPEPLVRVSITPPVPSLPPPPPSSLSSSPPPPLPAAPPLPRPITPTPNTAITNAEAATTSEITKGKTSVHLSKTPQVLWDENYPEITRFIETVYKPIIESADNFKKCSPPGFYKLCGRNINKQKKINKVCLDVKDLKSLFKRYHIEYLSKPHIRKALKLIEQGEFRSLAENLENAILSVNDAEDDTASSSSSNLTKRSSSLSRSNENTNNGNKPNSVVLRKGTKKSASSSYSESSSVTSSCSPNRAFGRKSTSNVGRGRSQSRTPSVQRGLDSSRSRTSSSFKKSEGLLNYELWLAASQRIKGIPPPLEGISSKEQVALRRRQTIKVNLRAKQRWLLALRIITTARHWAGVTGYKWQYDTTPVESISLDT